MLFVRDLWYVCACVYESSEASAYSFGLAPNPTRARRYPLNINPKPDPKPDSISGPAGSGRVADLYTTHSSQISYSLKQRAIKPTETSTLYIIPSNDGFFTNVQY